jgi:hypothetical protein
MATKTDPALWERTKKKVTDMDTAGTSPGQWSARKAQMAVRLYKQAGGGYIGKKSSSNSLVKWGKQDWTTKSGKPSSETGERYLPRKAIEGLSAEDYKRTSDVKKASKTQFSRQPMDIAEKLKRFM